ncbi:MAG: HAMP domain-containing sensor histidine kinase [Bdellovibrionota bacterium]
MNKKFKTSFGWSIEGKILFALLVVFVGVLAAAWTGAMKLKETVAANAAVMNVDPTALIEVQSLRNLAEAQIADSRAYFLMGSKSIFDKQRAEKQQFTEQLAKFQAQYGLPAIGEIVKRIEGLKQQEQEIFDQAQDFRDKNTESKIVGQFYQSKTSPLLAQMNQSFDEIAKQHDAELAHARDRARQAGLDAQALIPQGMTWLTQALSLLFLCLSLLVARMLRVRRKHITERERLVDAAKKAILARDEVISATSRDFDEPLKAVEEIAEHLKSVRTLDVLAEDAELLKGTVTEMRGIVEDIRDQKMADMSELQLRMDQLRISDILDDAQLMFQPAAKQKDITLQFDTVNQSVLAFVDRERVMRVLSSLIGNAIKFGKKHSRVNVKVRSDQQFVNISVADGGPGVPDAQLAGIYDNFWQDKKTADQGAGVSLAVVKTVIEAHGGTVKAESNLNGGTTFTFSLPRRRPVGAQLRKPTPSAVRRLSRNTETLENPEGPTL